MPLARVRLDPAPATTGSTATSRCSSPALPFHPSDASPARETRAVRGRRSGWSRKIARELGINVTGGSSSVVDAWDVLRLAAATARAQLLGAASLAWKLPAERARRSSDGVVSHASGASAHYGELAKAAASTPSGTVQPEGRAQWKLIGSAARRASTSPPRATARRAFGMDVRPARPALRGDAPLPDARRQRRRASDVDAALKLPGVERVVRLGSYAGSTDGARGRRPAAAGTRAARRAGARGRVAARRRRAASTAPRSSPRSSSARATPTRTTAASRFYSPRRRRRRRCARRRARVEAGLPRALPRARGDGADQLHRAGRRRPGRRSGCRRRCRACARAIAARVAGVPREDAVTVHVTYLGGGFGRRLDVDFVGQAVRVARRDAAAGRCSCCGRARKTSTPRLLSAGRRGGDARGLDAQGAVSRLAQDHQRRRRDHAALDGAQRCRARRPGRHARQDRERGPVRPALRDRQPAHRPRRDAAAACRSATGARSGHSHNAFFSEAFIDELAHARRAGPGRLPAGAAEGLAAPCGGAAARGASRPAGRATARAALGRTGARRRRCTRASAASSPRSSRCRSSTAGRGCTGVVCAADVGTVVNPGIVAQQMESAVIFGLSAALLRAHRHRRRRRASRRNFPSYPVLRAGRFAARSRRTWWRARDPPGGVGEIGTPPLAPALANALFALTGKRQRELPLTA